MSSPETWFDRVAPTYDTVLPFFAAFAEALLAQVAPAPGARVLDLGAGTGALTGGLLARGCAVTAIDSAPAMIARLRAAYPAATASVMDAHHLAFPARSFDLVIAGFVLTLVADPAAVCREIARVLVPGGALIATVPGPLRAEDDAEDPTNGLFAKYAAALPAGGGLGAPVAVGETLAAAGFVAIDGDGYLEVAVPVRDGEQLWAWLQTHGSRAFLDDLPPDQRDAFRRELLAAVPGPITLRRAATVWRAVART